MIIQKLNQVLTDSEVSDIRHEIARYIKKYMHNIPQTSLSEIARSCFVSKGMVSKFINELGYASYSDFQKDCIEYIDYQNQKKVSSIYNSIPLNTKLEDFYNASKDINQNVLEGKIQSFIKDLLDSRCLYIYGKDETEIIASYLQFKLDIIQMPAIIVNEIKKQYIVKENSLLLTFNKEIDYSLKEYFGTCKHWDIHDFFLEETTLSEMYLFLFCEYLSDLISVHKM